MPSVSRVRKEQWSQHEKDGYWCPYFPSATGPRPPDELKHPDDPKPNPNCLRRTRKTAPRSSGRANRNSPHPRHWNGGLNARHRLHSTAVRLIAALSVFVRCIAGVLQSPTGLDRAVRPFQRRRRVRNRRLIRRPLRRISRGRPWTTPPVGGVGCQQDAGG